MDQQTETTELMYNVGDRDQPAMTRTTAIPSGDPRQGGRVITLVVPTGPIESAALRRAEAERRKAEGVEGNMGVNAQREAGLAFSRREIEAVRAERAESDRKYLLQHETENEKIYREQNEQSAAMFAAERVRLDNLHQREQDERDAKEVEELEAALAWQEEQEGKEAAEELLQKFRRSKMSVPRGKL